MSAENNGEQATEGYVTVVTGGQLFGFKLARVRDVFVPRGLSEVPLAPPEIAGLLNLRGRIVTAIDLRRRLGLPPRTDGGTPVLVHRAFDGEEQLGSSLDLVQYQPLGTLDEVHRGSESLLANVQIVEREVGASLGKEIAREGALSGLTGAGDHDDGHRLEQALHCGGKHARTRRCGHDMNDNHS